MAAGRRFADWGALSAGARHSLAATAGERARRLEPRLNAFVRIEERPPAAPVAGPLAGMPYVAKDLFATGTRRPTGGLGEGIDFGLSGPAWVLEQLDGAGAYRVGFTAMTELAYEPSGYNSVRGRTANPWNLDFISGGSSSGSAASVASGSAVVGLGSDTGGSVRIPAHCCGVTGWKPTYGALSTAGALPLAPSLDVIGLIGRSAADMLPAADVLSPGTLPRRPPTIPRAAVLADALTETDEAVRRACEQGIEAIEGTGVALARADGLSMIETIGAEALTVMQGEAARVHRPLLDNSSLDPTLYKRLAKGLPIDDATLDAARTACKALARDFSDRVLRGADVLLLPVMPIRVPIATETDPTSPTFSPRRLYELSRFCRFVNMLGFPAVALPVGFDDRGLPVALQIVGKPKSDFALLALAAAVQEKTDWHARIPAAVADLIDDRDETAA